MNHSLSLWHMNLYFIAWLKSFNISLANCGRHLANAMQQYSIKTEGYSMKQFILYAAIAMPFIGCAVTSHPTPGKSVNTEKNVSARDGSLVFPVAGTKSNIGSFWGDGRDAGKRKHEGIDIFARKGTEVVAVCDGTVSVDEYGIGGKMIWLRADNHAWNAYYAHLDSQLVYNGQQVKKGDVVGTVGNTGNAKYTAAHLHFGIYTYAGAVDPLPYVKAATKVAGKTDTAEEKATQQIKSPVKKPVAKRKPDTVAKKANI